MPPDVLVLKIGGSLLASGYLTSVLGLVAKRTRPVIVVPGGGSFADQVRQSQKQHGFDDATAHRLALFAMHQMANVIVSRAPHFAPASTLEDFDRAHADQLVPVWLPSKLAGADASIPKSWDMTSDSLAAWLAGQLRGAAVALVKSCAVDPEASLATLSAAGVVDPLFQGYVDRHGLTWSVFGEGDEARLASLLTAPTQVPGASH